MYVFTSDVIVVALIGSDPRAGWAFEKSLGLTF